MPPIARIDGSITEWTPYEVEGREKFVFRRANGDVVASIGIGDEVETARETVAFRFDAHAACFVPVNGEGPCSHAVQPMSDFPKSA